MKVGKLLRSCCLCLVPEERIKKVAQIISICGCWQGAFSGGLCLPAACQKVLRDLLSF